MHTFTNEWQESRGVGGVGLFWLLAPPEQTSGMSLKKGGVEGAGNKYVLVL